MFKKLSYKILIALLVVLLIVYVATEYGGKDDRTFKSEIVVLDTALVSELVIQHPTTGEMTFSKKSNAWKLFTENKEYAADPKGVRTILDQLTRLKPTGIVAMDESKWREYQVDDSAGIHVLVKENEKIVADFFVGRLTYQKPPESVMAQAKDPQEGLRQGKMITYLRPLDDDAVYTVDGFVRPAFSRKPEDFRDKTMAKFSVGNLIRLDFSGLAGESFELLKENNKWYLGGLPVDSVKTARYLAKLANQKGSGFVDDYYMGAYPADYTLSINGTGFEQILINAYPADTVNKYVLTSSMNPGAVFSGKEGNIHEKIFAGRDYFLK